MLRQFSRFCLNLFFPRQCLGCGLPDTWICQNCWRCITPLRTQQCYICRKTSPQGKTCLHHQAPLDQLIVCAHYDGNPLLKKLLHELKYHSHPEDIADRLAALINKTMRYYSISPSSHHIIPVPLHAKRLRQRSFNQAELIAQDLPFDSSLLFRQHHTNSQVKNSSRSNRLKNLKGAFTAPKKLDPEVHYLLIDDVATTGSTLEECAKTLKTAGAIFVSAMVVARN